MQVKLERLFETGCETEVKDRICRSRGGESCAFDGAMIVLQPIADTAHIVHGPIACCGNSWEGRGTVSSKGDLYKMGFTTDMNEMDIIYGSEDKLYNAILKTYEAINPKAIFVYSTCVSGLIGEDIDAVCKKAEKSTGIRVIPVNVPGFLGPKNLGNRIAGEVLLDYVIGTSEPEYTTDYDINLIGEFNIAGDLWLVEPILKEVGIRVLSRITGDSTFKELTYAHRAKLNVIVCSRALINIAKEMQVRYRIPYVEVSFFGKTEMSKALRAICLRISKDIDFLNKVEEVILREERKIDEILKNYQHLKGKKAVLYTGGVKSWSFISALLDLGIEIVAIGTKKSSFEDEEKMKEILGEKAPLIEDVSPKNLLKVIKEKKADLLIAGGRNQYLAIKEGIPFVDVNQERHTPYAGYDGLINFAKEISNSIKFYVAHRSVYLNHPSFTKQKIDYSKKLEKEILINPLKHSQSIGAIIALQGIDKSLPIIHGAQGCNFLSKVLLTKHFREPIALSSTKLFTEDVVMGSEGKIVDTVKEIFKKNRPELIAILTSGLCEVKGDDVDSAVNQIKSLYPSLNIINVSTPDYEYGLEKGYEKALTKIIQEIVIKDSDTVEEKVNNRLTKQINVIAGSHLTPADFTELKEIIESFGLKPILLPDLSALDGSNEGYNTIAKGGTTLNELKKMKLSQFTIVVGSSLEYPAKLLKEHFGIEYFVFEGLSGLKDTDIFMNMLSEISGICISDRYVRQRKILVDSMRDAHFYISGKDICIALETDLAIQLRHLLEEMGANIEILNPLYDDFFSIKERFHLLISNSHGEYISKKLNIPLYQLGFPVYKILGICTKVTIGYIGSLNLINDIANKIQEVHS